MRKMCMRVRACVHACLTASTVTVNNIHKVIHLHLGTEGKAFVRIFVETESYNTWLA